MTNIYVVNHPVPFPSSEYGGIYIITANSEEQAVQVVKGQISKYDFRSYPKMKYIVKLIGTTDKFEAGKLIDSFIT